MTPAPARAWAALAALCVGLFTTMADLTLIAVAIPHIQSDLDATVGEAVWVSAIYLLAFAAPLLLTGRLGDRYGAKNLYLAGMSLFVVASAASAFAPGIEILIVTRGLQGLGAALLNPQPLSVINQLFPLHRRGAAMGVWAAVAASAGVVGPTLGGLIVSTAGWRWVFVIYLPLGLLSIVLTAVFVPRLPRRPVRIDTVSVLLSFAAITAVVVALQQGPGSDWAAWIWALLLVGIAALIVFVWRQRSVDRKFGTALVPPALFRYRNFAVGIAANSVLGFVGYSVALPIMLYFQTAAGLSAADAGLLMLPMAVTSILLSPVTGRLADRFPPGNLTVSGFALMLLSMLVFAVMMFSRMAPLWGIVPLVMLGAANALCWGSNSVAALRELPASILGAGSGAYNTSRQVGAAVGAATLGAAMQIGVARMSFADAMAGTMLVPAAVLVVGLVVATRFRNSRE
ncbi:MAG: DHA2 family efflux MFS transporter permease subunit [Leucobacter sp.]